MVVQIEKVGDILQHDVVEFEFQTMKRQGGQYDSPMKKQKTVRFERGVENAIAVLSGVSVKNNVTGGLTGTYFGAEHVLTHAEVADSGDKQATIHCEYLLDPGGGVFNDFTATVTVTVIGMTILR